jgi:H3 lysine-79-specific histone-lysine N-methyltransferase
MHQVYSRVVSDHAEKLRKYEAFSNNVYGEMNASFVSNIVREADIRRDSVFIDLGSGIGNVVLQVAALCGCACWGIEQMATPAQLALKQLEEFKTRAKCYRISTGPVTFIQGNFLEEKRVAELMKRATHVLCNNYAFSAELNQDLLQLFLDLPDGARIVSLKSFIAPDRRITKRTASSVENILSVKEHVYERGSVSWTATSGAWFIHTVDRQAVKQFWATMDDA